MSMAAKLQKITRLKSTPIFFFIRYGESRRIEAIAFRETDCFIVSQRTLLIILLLCFSS